MYGEGPQVLAEGGSKPLLGDARSLNKSPQVLAEGGSKPLLGDARSLNKSRVTASEEAK